MYKEERNITYWMLLNPPEDNVYTKYIYSYFKLDLTLPKYVLKKKWSCVWIWKIDKRLLPSVNSYSITTYAESWGGGLWQRTLGSLQRHTPVHTYSQFRWTRLAWLACVRTLWACERPVGGDTTRKMQTPAKAVHIQIIGSVQHTCGHATVEALLLEMRSPKSTSVK